MSSWYVIGAPATRVPHVRRQEFGAIPVVLCASEPSASWVILEDYCGGDASGCQGGAARWENRSPS
jgi:hypothetical protein